MKLDALVLAAGYGSRLASRFPDLPKPLVPLGGQRLIEWNLCWLAECGIEDVWINLHHRPELFREVLGDGATYGVRIHWSEEPEILGTAGAWKRLSDVWERTVIVVYGDNFMRFDLERLLARHRDGGCSTTIALFDPERHRNTGMAGGRARVDEDGRITGFMEGGVEGLVNAGVYLIEPAVAGLLPHGFSDFGRDVLPRLAAMGDLNGHVIEASGYCLGVDTAQAHARAEELLRTGAVVP